MDMKTLLLTGASGYLGSQFYHKYKSLGWNVFTLGRRPTDHIFWDAKSNREIDCSKIPDSIDKIIHCAAVNETSINRDINITFDVNVTLTRALADLAIKRSVKEFVYISTFHVYGVDKGLINPDRTINPLNDYGLTHYLSEEILRCVLSDVVPSILCLRPTNLFGMPVEMSGFDRWSLVPFDFVKSIVETGNISLRSSGEQYRNFVHCSHVLNAAPSLTGFEVKDVCGMTSTIKDFAGLVINHLRISKGIHGSLLIPKEFSHGNSGPTEKLRFQGGCVIDSECISELYSFIDLLFDEIVSVE